MPDTIEKIRQTEELYEALAAAIDEVIATAGDRERAAEAESTFLAKLAFLALRDIEDPARQKQLIHTARNHDPDGSED